MSEKLKGIPFDSNEIILPDGSAGYDNVLYSEDFAEWLRTYFKNGILVPEGALISTELQVKQTDDTHVSIDPGNMVVNGRTVFVENTISLNLNKTGPGLERYDRVVIELNLGTTVNGFRILISEGVMSTSPTLPDLIRDDEVYQMSLATIRMGQSEILSIEDTRSDDSECGISQVLIGVRTPLPVTGDEASNIGYDDAITNFNVSNVQSAIEVLAQSVSTEQQIILDKNNWSNNTLEVPVIGMTSDMTPIVDVIAETVEDNNAWSNIYRAVAQKDSITFYSSKNLDRTLNVHVKVVR